MPPRDTEPQAIEVRIVQDSADSVDGRATIVNPDAQTGQFQVTAAQFRALRRKYEQSADGANSF